MIMTGKWKFFLCAALSLFIWGCTKSNPENTDSDSGGKYGSGTIQMSGKNFKVETELFRVYNCYKSDNTPIEAFGINFENLNNNDDYIFFSIDNFPMASAGTYTIKPDKKACRDITLIGVRGTPELYLEAESGTITKQSRNAFQVSANLRDAITKTKKFSITIKGTFNPNTPL
jgi:hypothetical protein